MASQHALNSCLRSNILGLARLPDSTAGSLQCTGYPYQGGVSQCKSGTADYALMDTNHDNAVNCEDDCYSPFYPVSVPMEVLGWHHLAVWTLAVELPASQEPCVTQQGLQLAVASAGRRAAPILRCLTQWQLACELSCLPVQFSVSAGMVLPLTAAGLCCAGG